MVNAVAITAIEERARTQCGLFTTVDARQCFVTDRMLVTQTENGRWKRVAPQVYEVVRFSSEQRRDVQAAMLWGGDDALISHITAGAIYGYDGVDQEHPQVHLTLFNGTASPNPKWIVHRRRAVILGDWVEVGPLHLTSPIRTLFDLAAELENDVWERTLESALRRGYVTLDEVEDRFKHLQRTTKGRKTIRTVLAVRPEGAPATGSELETRFFQALRRCSVPTPVRQHPALDEEGGLIGLLDCAWPDVQLYVELDGKAFHTGEIAERHDRSRSNALTVRGWESLHFSWDDVVKRPKSTLRDVERAYARRSADRTS